MEEETEKMGEETKQVIFVSKARGMTLANFEKEVKIAGNIDKPEVPLKFFKHLKVTSDPAEIDFIRKAIAKGAKIKEFDSMEHAQIYISGLEVAMDGSSKGEIGMVHNEAVSFAKQGSAQQEFDRVAKETQKEV